MRSIIYILLIAVVLNVQIMRQDDGTVWSELWYNEKIVWRMAFLSDGARTVSGSNRTETTFIAPDISNGLFLIKVQ